MRVPEFIKKEDTIGFVAPSYGCSIEPYKSAFDNARKKLKERGYVLDLGPNCYEGKGIGISNTPEKCGEEINTYFAKDDVDALISCGGGELMCEILDFVDFEKLATAKPKWYMGFSDNTNLTFLLATICDMASIYGPCAPAFGMNPWYQSIEDAIGVLEGKKTIVTGYPKWEKESLKDEKHPLEPYHLTEDRVIKRVPDRDSTISGRIIGGCLDCLGKLVGTKYDKVLAFNKKYAANGVIWYFEACDLNVMDIRRTLWQLDHAGWFQNAKGFLVGRPLCHGEELFGLDQYDAVTGVLAKYNVPIIMDLDIGHIPPTMPMVNGVMAEVAVNGNEIEIAYQLENE